MIYATECKKKALLIKKKITVVDNSKISTVSHITNMCFFFEIKEVLKMANRKYYVEYCPYGVNLSYNSLNGNAYEFYCFKTKQERTAWLTKHKYNRFNERVAQETTIENVRRVMGRYFIIRGNQVFRASEGAFLL